MKSINQTLGAILYSPNQYVVPVFQRAYRWQEPQWQKLWDNLVDLRHPEKTGKHFMGFLVLVPETPQPGKITSFHVIDGQQRLTTLSLLLIALRDAATRAGFSELALEINETWLLHPHKKRTERYRLFPKAGDQPNYIAAVIKEGELGGRIAAALDFFHQRIAQLGLAVTEDTLRDFLNLLTQRLEFICATLEGDDAYNIYKSLNSTGVPLGAGDLIRNFVFMHVEPSDQDEFDESLWRPLESRFVDASGILDGAAFSAMFRDFLMRGGTYVKATDTFEAFEDCYSATAFNATAIARQLNQTAADYAVLRGQAQDGSSEVENALAHLRRLDSSTTLPLLLNLFERRREGQLSDRELAEAVDLLAGFILRRFVCGESSRAYSLMFVEAARVLGERPLENLTVFLGSRTHPDTQRFQAAFVGFNLYQSRYAKHVLERLEAAHPNKEPANLAVAQIEHVLPQTLTDDWIADLGQDAARIHAVWLHTPGNLTLTGYNPELSNKSFGSKRTEYLTSHYMMTKEVGAHLTWGETEIDARGRRLAALAAALWPGPAEPQPVRVRPVVEGLRQRYWAEFREHLRSSGSGLAPHKARDTNWLNFNIAGGGRTLVAYTSPKNRRIAVGLYLGGPRANEDFRALLEHRIEIEAQLGDNLIWRSDPAQKSREIKLRHSLDPSDRRQWEACFKWTEAMLEAFERILRPLLPSRDAATSLGSLYREYFTAFRTRLLDQKSFLRPRKAVSQNWLPISLGRTGFYLAAVASTYSVKSKSYESGEIRAELVIDHRRNAKDYFAAFEQSRVEIEDELGEQLVWYNPADARSCTIHLRAPADVRDRSDWPRQHDWLGAKLEALHKVFVARVQALQPGAA